MPGYSQFDKLDSGARMGETPHSLDATIGRGRERQRHQAGRSAHPPRPDRVPRIRLQAALRVAHRHGAREIRPSPRGPCAAPLRRPVGHPRASGRASALRLDPIPGERQPHRAPQGRPIGDAGAGRPARALGRPAPQPAPHLRRGARASRSGAHGLRGARHRLLWRGLPPRRAARGDPLDAQGPLQDHAPLHADARQPRPRHDDAHLHRAGQSRLRLGNRHGPQDAHRHGLAADCDGALRQLALRRGQAQRLPQLSQPRLDRYGPRSLRPALVRLRARHGVRALCRLRARRAHVFRGARRRLRGRGGRILPRLPRRRPAPASRRAADDEGLGGSPDHGVPRGAPQDLHRDARDRQRAVGQDLLAAGALGRPALRFDGAQRGRGAHRLLVGRRCRGACTKPRHGRRSVPRSAGGRRRTWRATPWRSRPGA